MLSLGLTSAAAMAARNPAAPPPIRRTSCEEASTDSPHGFSVQGERRGLAKTHIVLPEEVKSKWNLMRR